MTISKNAPCICGSGKKYKKCCFGKESKFAFDDVKNNSNLPYSFIECEIDELSNSVIDLIESKEFDKAKEICHRLMDVYPDQVDGIERLAAVYEAEGNLEKSIEYYRKTIEFMKVNPGFDGEGIKFYEKKTLELIKKTN